MDSSPEDEDFPGRLLHQVFNSVFELNMFINYGLFINYLKCMLLGCFMG